MEQFLFQRLLFFSTCLISVSFHSDVVSLLSTCHLILVKEKPVGVERAALQLTGFCAVCLDVNTGRLL